MIRGYRLFPATCILALTACQSSGVSPLPQSGIGAAWTSSAGAVKAAFQNGSFELPVVPSGSYTLFSTGQSFSHWKVTGSSGNVGVVSGSFVFNGYTFPAACGAQWLDLTGSSNSKTGVIQTIQTVSGKTYTIVFEVGNAYASGTSSTVLVYVNGKKLFSARNSKGKGVKHQVWEQFSTQFTAASLKATIKFLNGDPPSDTDNGLDCITVTQV